MLAVEGRYPFSTAGAKDDVPINDFGRIFGYNGVFDRFYKDNLDRLVDNSRTPWQWRADASGEAVGLGQGVLRQFEQAQEIREMFFRNGASSPELKFTVTFDSLNQAASRVVMEIEGQSFAYRFEASRALSATWPGGPNPGTAALTFEERGGGRPNTEFKGAWALFKLFDSAQPRTRGDREDRVDVPQATAPGGSDRGRAERAQPDRRSRLGSRFSCGG